MRILVINSGSSSIKFSICDASQCKTTNRPKVTQSIVHGTIRGIGRIASFEIAERENLIFQADRQIDSHELAFTWMFDTLKSLEGSNDICVNLNAIEAIGHRVVHGGDRFTETTLIDADVLQQFHHLNELAPQHNPVSLEGIQASKRFMGDSMPMVAVFDTTFHRTLPDYAHTYAIPWELTQRHQIKRYGFHGIAHASLAHSYATHTNLELTTQRLITLQLGHGCSMTAIANGTSIDTTMGFTPCEGLMMGTRSGDVDPSVVSYLSHKEQVSVMGVQGWLNEHSGLLGVSQQTSDMRALIQAAKTEGNNQAKLAIDMFCYRIQKYLGAYWGVLGGVDAVIFGGGIGEHAPDIRTQICKGMEWSGLKLDTHRNQSVAGMHPRQVQLISEPRSSIGVYVAGTDEETLIADETVRCLELSTDKKEVTDEKITTYEPR